MRRGTHLRLWLVTGFLLVTCIERPAYSWEFSMNGIFTWKYDTFSQMGANGFFGPYDNDASGAGYLGYGGDPGSAASMNGWLGHEIGQIASGSDLALATIYMVIQPELRLSQALRVRGSYRIGSWETPWLPTSAGSMARSEYAEGMAPGIQRSFSPGYWQTLWASVQTPWGIIVFGKAPAPWGPGLMFDGTDNCDAAGLVVVTNQGPFRFVIFTAPWLLGSPYYYALADKNAVRQTDIGAGMTYDAGPLSLGLGGRFWKYHTGPESATFQGEEWNNTLNGPTGRYAVISSDSAFTDGAIFMKYFNGRFFFNAEADWAYRFTRRQKWLSNAPGDLSDGSLRSLFASDYDEHWRYMVELGAISGPAKLSMIWAWTPGPDRRHGIRIDRQGMPDTRVATGLTNVTLFKQYSLLLSYTYAAGNNSYTPDSRHGYMTDANIYGLRLDYSIAANLNVFGTLFHADRLSHGYGWGFSRPEYAVDRFTGKVQFIDNDSVRSLDSFTNPAPSIPDNNLGYEFDFGFGWKIFENYTIQATFGIWQPGGWFRYACIDRSVPNWKNPSSANSWGTSPGRTIDQVFGMEFMINVEY